MEHRGYKYRIYPNEQQRELMEKTFGCSRLLYNLSLEIKQEAYRITGKSPSAFDLCKQMVELKKDEQYSWLKEPDSQALQASIKRLDVAYKNFFKHGSGFPKFKKKSGEQSFQCPHEVKRIDWDKSTLTIPKMKDIPIVLTQKFDGAIKTITISKTPSGKYYASILVHVDKPNPEKAPVTENTAVGIDLGVKSLITFSNGKKIESPKWYRDIEPRLRLLQRRVSRKKKVQPRDKEGNIIEGAKLVDSNRKKKAKQKVALLHEKAKNQRIDFLHKTSFRTVRDNQAIVMEDLNLRGMSAKSKPKQDENGKYLRNNRAAKSGLSKSILDAGLGYFTTMLEYKCEWYGKTLIKIGRFEPSSKLCSHCHHKNEMLKLSDRFWTCEICNTRHDRDENAAINIKRIGLEQYCNKKGTGEPRPVEPEESLNKVGTLNQEIAL